MTELLNPSVSKPNLQSNDSHAKLDVVDNNEPAIYKKLNEEHNESK